MKFYLPILALIFIGCKNVPQGYEEIKPILELKGRTVAILPFVPVKDSGAENVDGVKLAELAARHLTAYAKDSKVIGPSRMKDALGEGNDEEDYINIARATGAKILVVGQIQSLTTIHDKLVQSREGRINIKAKVIDTTSAERPEYNITWGINFPPSPNQKYDPAFLTMTDEQFRDQMLLHASKWVAGMFYYHLREKTPESQIEVKWGFEKPVQKGGK